MSIKDTGTATARHARSPKAKPPFLPQLHIVSESTPDILLTGREMAPQRPKPHMESILLSKPFKFLVGPKKKEFALHRTAVSRLSKSLDQLVNGRMREAKEQCVSWEDTDEKTFIRFGEWAYTGDYTPGEPEILLDASQVATSQHDSADVPQEQSMVSSLRLALDLSNEDLAGPSTHCNGYAWGYSTHQYACTICKVLHYPSSCPKCRVHRNSFCAECLKGPAMTSTTHRMMYKFESNDEYASQVAIQTPRVNEDRCEDFTEVFLSHARLYVLADKYDIPELRQICLHYLHATLITFNLYEDSVEDVINLVKYSFKNTVEKDKLRNLLVQYCGCFTKEMTKSALFQDLVAECPEFGSEMMKEIGRHIN
ncbi:hypothetical protein TgHK011_003503 [Trichoderma gracile]|nr:hypothetical protein TgHK011_003503 [Trichoderma gracile]